MFDISSIFNNFESRKIQSYCTMEKTLGSFLKDIRALKNLSLRHVEAFTKISNAYLSQLENDKIKNPSISTLHKLSDFYKIDFSDLLEVAGIAKSKKSSKKKSVSGFALSSEPLTAEEEEELIKYLKFLRSQK